MTAHPLRHLCYRACWSSSVLDNSALKVAVVGRETCWGLCVSFGAYQGVHNLIHKDHRSWSSRFWCLPLEAEMLRPIEIKTLPDNRCPFLLKGAMSCPHHGKLVVFLKHNVNDYRHIPSRYRQSGRIWILERLPCLWAQVLGCSSWKFLVFGEEVRDFLLMATLGMILKYFLVSSFLKSVKQTLILLVTF